jgi:hypothetical protein
MLFGSDAHSHAATDDAPHSSRSRPSSACSPPSGLLASPTTASLPCLKQQTRAGGELEVEAAMLQAFMPGQQGRGDRRMLAAAEGQRALVRLPPAMRGSPP